MQNDLYEKSVYDLFQMILGMDNPTRTKHRRKHGLDYYKTTINNFYQWDNRLSWLADHTIFISKYVGYTVVYKLEPDGVQLLADYLNAYIKTLDGKLYSPKRLQTLNNAESKLIAKERFLSHFRKKTLGCRNCPLACSRADDTSLKCKLFGDGIPSWAGDGMSCWLSDDSKTELYSLKMERNETLKPFTREDAFFSVFKCYYDTHRSR